MYPSTYLSWFRRLLILGAVVAGLTASAAGARLDPGTPPDVSDVKSALSTQATIVSRPPDVQDAATSVNAAAPDVFERYAAAHPSDTRLFTGYGTETYSYPDPSLFHASSSVSTPPDVQDAMTALHTTPESQVFSLGTALFEYQQSKNGAQAGSFPASEVKAGTTDVCSPASCYSTAQGSGVPAPNGRPIVQTAPGFPQLRVGSGFSFAAPTGWTQPTPLPATGSESFDWGDAGIGAAGSLGIVLLIGGIGAVLLVARNRRQPKHA
jgi:hypothetical protein